MAVQFKWAWTSYTSEAFPTATTFNISNGALAVGDLLLLFVNDPQRSGIAALNPSTGWTWAQSISVSSGNSYLYYRYLTTTAGEGSYSVTMNSAVMGDVVLVAYTGTDSAGPIRTFSYAYNNVGNDTTIQSPSVSALPGDFRVAYGCTWDYPFNFSTDVSSVTLTGNATGSGPLGLQRAAVNGSAVGNNQGHSCFVYDEPMNTASGQVGTVNMNIYSSLTWCGQVVVLIPANTAPNAPTLTAPANNAAFDRTLAQTFSWTFSDDPWDSQNAYEIRYRIVGAPSWTTVSSAIPDTDQFHQFAGSFFAAGDYEWQARTRDISLWSNWSASRFFTAAAVPATPNITAPLATVTQPNQTVTWTAGTHTAYQLRTVLDTAGAPDPTTIYSDTGEITDGSATSRSVNFPVNGRTEWIQFRIKNQGLWSGWDSEDVTVSYTPPSTPTVALTANQAAATITVQITNPAGGQALSYNEVWVDDGLGAGYVRLATGLAANASYTYRTPRANYDYDLKIFARAVGTNTATADSTHT